MKYDITVMSTDGSQSQDPHQKYGFEVEADSPQEAEQKGYKSFRNDYPYLPIYWIEVVDTRTWKRVLRQGYPEQVFVNGMWKLL